MSPSEARSRITAQATDEQRRAVADVVLTNDGTLAQLRAAVDQLWQTLTERAGSASARDPG
jgi:dephospho-CoA kinase